MNHLTRRTMLQRGGMLGAVLALDAVSPALAETTPAGSSARFKAIDAALRGGVSRNDVAGVIAVAATPKGVVYEGAFGKANVATGAAMTLDTVFWLLSMTKAFTATACMQLIEQGRLHLDDDAAKYLPELASPQVLEGFAEDGTPRMRPARRAISRVNSSMSVLLPVSRQRCPGVPRSSASTSPRPASLAALRRVSGVGPTKIDRYGEELLAVISARVRAWRAVGVRHQHGLGRQAG